MSYARFIREHGAAMRHGDEADHRQRMDEAYESVRDRWLAEKHYAALVKAIIGNWTSGNCVEYMRPLTKALISEGQLELHRHLWSRTVKRQVNGFFGEYSFIRPLKLTFQDILSIDSTGFDEFELRSWSDHSTAASFLLKALVSGLSQWRDELAAASLATDDPDLILESLRSLRQPSIEVNRLPPNSSFKPKPLSGSAEFRR